MKHQMDASARVTFQIGPKGRSVLPAVVRRAAGVSEKDMVTAYADGPGRIILETRTAVQARIWAAARDNAAVDGAVATQSARAGEVAVEEANHARRSRQPSEEAADDAGRRLLAELGL